MAAGECASGADRECADGQGAGRPDGHGFGHAGACAGADARQRSAGRTALRAAPREKRAFRAKMAALALLLAALFFLSFWIGSYPAAPGDVCAVLLAKLSGASASLEDVLVRIVWEIRFPRIACAILIGGSLSVSGASYQTIFKNPMVSPDILGVSAGASFGAALVMLNSGAWYEIQASAFAFGLVAVVAAYVIGTVFGKHNIAILVLAGVVVSSLFQALVSILKTLADTDSALPEITFWLMGSLGKADNDDVAVLLPAIAVGLAALFLLRHRIDALAAGDEEAMSLGVNVPATKAVVIGCSTLMTVASVSICGVIGWVGLVVPHIARSLVGARFGRLMAASFLGGGMFLLVIDDIIRGGFGVDLPLGVMTALVGTPVFVGLLAKTRRMWT